ncbi:MAG: hypothetical protein HYV26_03535 [Candidatus Hydrogenedentes bacterium]|nr:hypothetical protein [Candidatus Hydrogenedentota bacterium]
MFSRFPHFGLLSLALLAIAGVVHAQIVQPIRITLGSGVGNPGDTVEITLSLVSGNTPPETMVLFLNYDPDLVEPFTEFYEFIQTDLAGNPVRDDDGNVITTTSAVRPEAAVLDADKLIQSEIEADYISIAIVGINAVSIPDGLLATVAFRIQPGTAGVESIPIDGDEVFSSASRGDSPGEEISIPVEMTDGAIEIGCVPPSAPTGLTASQNQPDAVELSWNAVAIAGAEYRVFRNTVVDINTAVPLGEGWQTETSFTDLTALAPEISGPPACPPLQEVQEIRYNYWVVVRGADGCISEFSSPPVVGFRGAATAAPAGLTAQASTAAPTLLIYGLLLFTLVFKGARTSVSVARGRRCPRSS